MPHEVSGRDEVRALLRRCRSEWVSGHGDAAWELLARARRLPGAASVPVELLAAEAGLSLLAERPDDARALASTAIDIGAQRRLGRDARIALADARVTLASLDVGDLAQAERASQALEALDAIAADPALREEVVAARAASNALLARLEQVRPALDSVEGQVQAWLAVSRALSLAGGHLGQISVQRQAVDLAMQLGAWQRGWDFVGRVLEAPQERNEQVPILAKAAMLAWHRQLLPQAREFGTAARDLSVGVDLPWVRVYAYLGGVLAAAAGAGSVPKALRAYTRCTTRAGHRTRPDRAWEAAQVALDAGLPVDEVDGFLEATVPDHGTARSRVLIADAAAEDPDERDVRTALTDRNSAVDRARVLLAHARSLRRHGLLGGATAAVRRALPLLREWPGLVLTDVESELALLIPVVEATPAQQRVLELLADGHTNAAIASRIGCSERTIAVHVAALLRSAGARTRTELAAMHLRRALVS